MKLQPSPFVDKDKHYGHVSTSGGLTSLILNDKDYFQKRLLELTDQDVEITVNKRKRGRSLSQNALYWVWATIIGNDLGYPKDEMHFVFKRLFLADKMPVIAKDEFMEYLSETEKENPSTTKLATLEMKEFMDKVYEQARNLGIILPLPEIK